MPEQEEVRLTLRIPGPLHEALRVASFETRRSRNSIILEALARHPDVARALRKQGRE